MDNRTEDMLSLLAGACGVSVRDEWAVRKDERKRICKALTEFLDADKETFRSLLPFLALDYAQAYDEGWMGFTNALSAYTEEGR